jgi:hypothetical protein
MDVSLDHEPTHIERGTDVHLNHPLTARRGTHDSRPVRWESWAPHPSAPRRGGEGVDKQAGKLALIASSRPRLGVSTYGSGAQHMATPPGRTQMQANADTCTWHRRGWLKYHRGRLQQTPRTPGARCGKTLQECTHSSKASGVTPAGALACPHGTTQRPGGKKVPLGSTSLCGFLRIPLQRLGAYC